MSVLASTPIDVHRHLSPAAAARLLGRWHAGGAAYTALADALRAAVLAGTLAPYTRLPSERDLAAALGVSRTTTAAAYGRLRELGFARSRTGSGTVVVLPRTTVRRPAPHAPGGDAPAASAPHVTSLDLSDLSQATSAAPSGLHAAYSRALERLPEHLSGGGYEPYGVAALREALAERHTARGTPTAPEEILVTTGGQHAITTVATTLLGAGDRAVVQSPTYYHAMEALRRAGARLVPVPVGRGDRDGRDAPGFDVELFDSTLRQVSPRLAYLVPDFHNPTAYTLTDAERAGVRDAAARHRVTVMGDETLTDLDLDGDPDAVGPVAEPLAGDGSSPYVVTVGSASKSFWGGLRVGWVRAHPDLVARLARTRQSADIATAVLEQLTVVELLDDAAAVLAERRRMLRDQRDLLCGLLARELPSWNVHVPEGGLSLWVDVGAPVAQALAAAATAEGVLVNAGPTFTPDGSATDHLRLTFSRSPEELERAVGRLATAWGRVTR